MLRTSVGTAAAGRVGAAVLIGALAVTLTGCGSKTVTLSGSSGPAPAAGSASTEPDTAAAASSSWDQGFAFPDLPQIVIPDVTSFTKGSQQYAEKLGEVAARALE